MQTNYFGIPLQSGPDGADPSINIQELTDPEVETNLDEGDEYLDNKTRMKDQPFHGGEKNEKN